MFVIEAVVVEDVLAVVSRPLPGVLESVGVGAGGAVRQEDLYNFAFVVQGVHVL